MREVQNDSAYKVHQRRILQFCNMDGVSMYDRAQDLKGSDEPPELSSDILKPTFNDKGPVLAPMTMIPTVGEYHVDFTDPREHVQFVGPQGAHLRAQSVSTKRMQPVGPGRFRLQRGHEASVARFLRGVSFLRANQEDVEMISLDQKCGAHGWDRDIGVVCQ